MTLRPYFIEVVWERHSAEVRRLWETRDEFRRGLSRYGVADVRGTKYDDLPHLLVISYPVDAASLMEAGRLGVRLFDAAVARMRLRLSLPSLIVRLQQASDALIREGSSGEAERGEEGGGENEGWQLSQPTVHQEGLEAAAPSAAQWRVDLASAALGREDDGHIDELVGQLRDRLSEGLMQGDFVTYSAGWRLQVACVGIAGHVEEALETLAAPSVLVLEQALKAIGLPLRVNYCSIRSAEEAPTLDEETQRIDDASLPIDRDDAARGLWFAD